MSSETAPAFSPSDWAFTQLANLDAVITYMETTSEDAWRTETVRSADGSTNCFFGHLFNMGADDEQGSALWNWFEELWATTYMVYPVNDGQNEKYQQKTPKKRMLAYLRALADGTEMTTEQAMEAEYQWRTAPGESSGETLCSVPTHIS